jgi:hypothetical protein
MAGCNRAFNSPDVTFQYAFFVWDNRRPLPDAPRESISPDLGMSMTMVATCYGPDTRYATMEFNSSESSFEVTDGVEHYYAAYITWDHILSVIGDYNEKADAHNQEKPWEPAMKHASLDPNDYSLSFITAGPEMFIYQKENGTCHFGSSVKNLYLYLYTG